MLREWRLQFSTAMVKRKTEGGGEIVNELPGISWNDSNGNRFLSQTRNCHFHRYSAHGTSTFLKEPACICNDYIRNRKSLEGRADCRLHGAVNKSVMSVDASL